MSPIQWSIKSEPLRIGPATSSWKSAPGDSTVQSPYRITAVGSKRSVQNFDQGNNMIRFAFEEHRFLIFLLRSFSSHINVYRDFIHKSPNVEKTQMSLNGQMDKLWHIHITLLILHLTLKVLSIYYLLLQIKFVNPFKNRVLLLYSLKIIKCLHC